MYLRFLSDAPKKEVYFMAVIDILTPYDAKKKAAHAAKTVKHGVRPNASSSFYNRAYKKFQIHKHRLIPFNKTASSEYSP